MLALAPRPKESVNWMRAVGLLGILLVLLAFVPLRQASPAIQRADPSVLQIAAQHPDQPISVIVQKQSQGSNLEALVGQLGGRVTLDLHIIDAIAATLPARGAAQLAQAAGVRWVSLDAPLLDSSFCSPCVNSKNLKNSYIRAIGADRVWNEAPRYLQGQSVGVVVVDSGITPQVDFYSPRGAARVVAAVTYNDDNNRTIFDGYGHGTHVAGIIGGDGQLSRGAYIGVAPMANLLNVKVSNDDGGD